MATDVRKWLTLLEAVSSLILAETPYAAPSIPPSYQESPFGAVAPAVTQEVRIVETAQGAPLVTQAFAAQAIVKIIVEATNRQAGRVVVDAVKLDKVLGLVIETAVAVVDLVHPA